MMIAPALKGCPPAQMEALLAQIQVVLARFEPCVVFADFNLDLNLLWVSHACRQGLGSEIAMNLQHAVPELRLVAQPPDLA